MAGIVKKQVKQKLYLSANVLRSVNFAAQSLVLPLIEGMAGPKSERELGPALARLRMVFPKIARVISQDAENVAEGLYPPSVLFEELPWQHYLRLPNIMKDAFRAARQRRHKKSAVFESTSKDFLEDVPEYFRRNFHFQKSGYLSDDSANLYDHQVEVLFAGAAQAMRRQIIPMLKRHFGFSDGEGLRFLEIGSGTGALTRSVALAFPKARITCVDLSAHQLGRAKQRLKKFKRIDFLQGRGEDLDFKGETFDAVFSCYLFHELPETVRNRVLEEKIRALKPGGFLGVVDSLQKSDDPDLDWALEQFPRDYHEPFYKNYIERSLENELSKHGLSSIGTETWFFSKVVGAIK